MALTRRSLLALAGVGALGGALAGCSGALPKVDTAAASFGKDGAGEVEVWCRAATQTGIGVIVDNFHRQQDRIRVRVTAVPDSQFVTKLATAIRGGRVPDLVDFDDINSMLFIYRGAFADLTDAIGRLPNADALSPGHLRLATNNGRIYALPFLADNSVLFCNTELFEQAGLDVDQSTQSLETLLEAARKISRLRDDIYGWSYPGNGTGALGFTVQPHIWAAKTDLLAGTVGHQHGKVAGNQAAKATLEFCHRLWAEKLVPALAYADDGSHWGSDFLAGQIGMFPGSYGAVVPAASKDMLAKTTIRLLPGPTGGRAFFDGGDNLCMLNGAPNPNAAWEFAAFCVTVAQQQRLPDGGYAPIRSDAATPQFRKQYPLATPTITNIEAGYAPTTLAYNSIYNQSDGPWLAMFRKAVFGGQVEAAMDEAQVGYDRILRQAQA
ncbi:MAG TPA: sugar ABC transporter substrate-binding protein [Microlunatus sp.]